MPPKGASTKLKVPEPASEDRVVSPLGAVETMGCQRLRESSVSALFSGGGRYVKAEETFKGHQPENPLLAAGLFPTQ